MFRSQILFVLWIVLWMTTAVFAEEPNRIYWSSPADDTRPWSVSFKPGETCTLRLKAEVPGGEILNAYKIILLYSGDIVSIVSAVSSPGAALPFSNINTQFSGQIITNGFTPSGVPGPCVISLIDVQMKGETEGRFDFLITVESFGTNTFDQFIPLSDTLTVQVMAGEPFVLTGDVNNTGQTDLTDNDLSLQMVSGISPVRPCFPEADMNGDQKIGLEESIYILRKITTPVPGDMNGDHEVDLRDAVMGFQIMSGMAITGARLSADLNQDGKIGLEEVICTIRRVSTAGVQK